MIYILSCFCLNILALFRPGFFRLSGTGGGGYVTLKPLTLWSPNLNRIVYALILISTKTVMSLCGHFFLNVSLRSSKAINLLNTVPDGVKILLLAINGSIIYFLNLHFWKT